MLHSCICGAFSAVEASFVCVYLPVFDKVQAQGRHLAVTAWHCLHSLTTADARFLLLAMRHTFSSLIHEDNFTSGGILRQSKSNLLADVTSTVSLVM